MTDPNQEGPRRVPEPEVIPVEPTPDIGPEPGRDFDFPNVEEQEPLPDTPKPWKIPDTWKN